MVVVLVDIGGQVRSEKACCCAVVRVFLSHTESGLHTN